MITTLTGKNQYVLHSQFSEQLHSFIGEYGETAVEYVSGADIDQQKLKIIVQSLPFLTKKRLVVIQDLADQKHLQEMLEDLLQDVPDSTEVILYDTKLDKRTRFYKFLQKETTFTEAKELDEFALKKWVAQTAKERRVALDASLSRYLVERVGLDQWQLSNEIDKLGLFDQTITKELIDEIVALHPRDTIFELLEVIMKGDAQKSTAILERLRINGIDPHYVISMLAWQMHAVSIMVYANGSSPDQLSKDSGVSAFVLKKSTQIANRLSKQQLRKILQMIVEVDQQLKTQAVDADNVVEHLIMRITKQVSAS